MIVDDLKDENAKNEHGQIDIFNIAKKFNPSGFNFHMVIHNDKERDNPIILQLGEGFTVMDLIRASCTDIMWMTQAFHKHCVGCDEIRKCKLLKQSNIVKKELLKLVKLVKERD